MARPSIQDLLLAPQLSPEAVLELLAPYGFVDPHLADATLQAMAKEPSSRRLLAEILEPLLAELSRSPDPDQALIYFGRFTESALSPMTFLSYLKDVPHAIPLLARVFGASPFMSQILQRDPYHLYFICDPRVLEKGRSRKDLDQELRQVFRTIRSSQARMDLLRAFKRKEMLRIGVRDLLRESTVGQTVRDLTVLADLVVKKTLKICREDLRKKWSPPPGLGSGFVVLAMGKLGGGELNFSSDIDLIYLYEQKKGGALSAKRSSGARVAASEYYQYLAQEVTTALSRITQEGMLFRVDLRLRPEGSTGTIAGSLSSYLRYYQTRGRNWERLALLKAWPIAGDLRLGRRFLKRIRPFIFPRSVGEEFFREVWEVKGQIERKLSSKGDRSRNIKLGAGGIREIEFLVQTIQVVFGRKNPHIQDRNTLSGVKKLQEAGLLSDEEGHGLKEAYLFLRDVEHKLQMVDETQTHSLPSDTQGLRRCALRLGYRDQASARAEVQFQADLDRRRAWVRRLFEGLFHSGGSKRFRRRRPLNRRG